MRNVIRPTAVKLGISRRIGWHTFGHYAECGIGGTPMRATCE